MIPDAGIEETLDTSEIRESSKTYKVNEQKIQGHNDSIEALQQTIEKLLCTEKYEYPIYNFSYGIDIESLVGKDKLYVQMELQRRIKECLEQDDRIQSVENFEFNLSGDSIVCTFDVNSIYGVKSITKEVNA